MRSLLFVYTVVLMMYGGQFVVEVSRHSFHVQVVEDEEAEAPTRCLHFVLPLAGLGLALIETRDFSEYALNAF